jgi:hypothetical protein
MPAADFNFVAAVIDVAGRPSEPIVVRGSTLEIGN